MFKKDILLHIEEIEDVLDFVKQKSIDMYTYMEENSDKKFSVWSKILTHSDLITRGKRCGEQGLEKNILYYITLEEMQRMEENQRLWSAKQSNIGMPEAFFNDIQVPKIKRRQGKQTEQHKHIKLNDYLKVYIVNETCQYFVPKYTEKILESLKKEKDYVEDLQETYFANKKGFSEIEITEAIHGLGVSKDVEFTRLRENIFLNDRITFVIEYDNEKPISLYVLLEKNPIFYTITGIASESWIRYLELENKQQKSKIKAKQALNYDPNVKSRKLQTAWKNRLAEEILNYSDDNKIFCTLTKIRGEYEYFPMLFIASHIKSHASCESDEESFELENGLLLSPNADALFDKHMITISEDKRIIFSFLLDNKEELKNDLLLTGRIFTPILTERRMKNLEEHRKIFYEKEAERKLATPK